MQLTNFSELEHAAKTATAGVGRFDDEFGYTDEETFERPRFHARERHQPSACELARRQASAMDDDEVADIALHFGER